VTHEYVIASGGRIVPGREGDTAIAWAADHVLAVGEDDVVRAMSRGDSTFLDLAGCLVTALPGDPRQADALVSGLVLEAEADGDPVALLARTGLLDRDAILGPGSPADLAFWDIPPTEGQEGGRGAVRLVAVLRAGAFVHDDARRGPFRPAARQAAGPR
jgi:hypothetical protein